MRFAVAIRAENDGVLKREEPALRLGDAVMNVAACFVPAALHAFIAQRLYRGVMPGRFVGIDLAIDGVSLAAIPCGVPFAVVPALKAMWATTGIDGLHHFATSAFARGEFLSGANTCCHA